MTGSKAAVLAAARSQVGYNGAGTCNAPITKFGAWWGAQTQWCDEFVSWCLVQGGMNPLGGPKGRAYVPYHLQDYRNAGQFHSGGPQSGDVVFYSWGMSGLSADHIGIVESVNADGSINTIEGNTDDPQIPHYYCGNCCRRKRRSGSYIVGYGRPAYATTPVPDPSGGGGLVIDLVESDMDRILYVSKASAKAAKKTWPGIFVGNPTTGVRHIPTAAQYNVLRRRWPELKVVTISISELYALPGGK